MGKPHTAAPTAGNVVKLPGAAKCKVENGRYADQRRVSLAARRASLFADRYRSPHDRAADLLAGELADITQTPELLIVSAILRTMEADAVTNVLEQLAPGAVAGSKAHRQAVTTVKVSRMNIGQQFDLMRALDRLRAEGN